jgi:hypothetical protein
MQMKKWHQENMPIKGKVHVVAYGNGVHTYCGLDTRERDLCVIVDAEIFRERTAVRCRTCRRVERSGGPAYDSRSKAADELYRTRARRPR